MTERIVNVERVEDLISVFGSLDENIHRIEQELGVQILNRGSDLKISGEEEAADKAARTIEGLMALASKGEIIDEQKVRYLITLVQSGNDDQVAQMARDVVCITAKGKPIKAKTIGQQKYMKAIQKNTITVGVGPAGTGKTYLAVAAAVAAFRERRSRFPGADCEPDHSDPTGGGGRGAPGLFARRSAKQGRPLSAATV
ncbi:phoH family protein [Firmicutes bacterium CAG:137]|nr:phoH family protein [Firmicutes bacterium CAG:137]